MKFRARPWFWASVPLWVLIPVLLWQGRNFTSRLDGAERLRTQQNLVLHADAVQRAFDRIEAKLDSLTVFVASQTGSQNDVDVAQFNMFADGLYASAQWIRAFQVVSNGIITHAYPRSGNEAIVGYNLLADPRPVLGGDVLRAQRTGRVTITGPIELIQGGLGIMVRKPVPPTNRPPARLAAIILNIAPLLAEAGMESDVVNDERFGLRRDSGEVFFGSPTLFQQQPVTHRIDLPDGSWEMAACPRQGWHAVRSLPVALFYGGGTAVILLLSALFFALARRDVNRSETIQEQTKALRRELAARQKAQEQFHLIMENLTDMVAVLDLNGHRLYNSPSYDKILGDPEILVGTSSFEEIHPDDRHRVQQAFRETVRTGVGHRLQYRLVDQHGHARHIESQGSVIRDDQGRVVKVVVVSRDVTERQQTERVLHENEARYRFLFEHNPMPMLIYERGTLQMLAVNEAFERHYGYSEAEALTLHLTDLYPEDQKEKIAALIPTLHGHAEVGEWHHRKRDGSFITILVSSHDLVYDGRAARVAVMSDITRRKQVEIAIQRERDFSATVLNSLPGVFYCYDKNLRFRRWNKNFERVTGYTADEIARLSPLDFFAGADKALLAERIGDVFDNGVAEVEADFVTKDGRRIPYYFTGLTAELDGQTQLVGVGIDITARKRVERELRDTQAGLEERVFLRTTELAVAKEHAELADRLKSAFLATMSHELRTPLNSIIGFTGIILQGLAGPLNAEQAKQLEMVRKSARHLLALINDVLDISKIEAGQIEIAPVPFNLREAIEKAMHIVTPLAEKKQLTLATQMTLADAQITSDRRRVEQILLNLLSNAIKFTERGVVTLGAEAVADGVRISVSDTGIGIKAEDLGKLFQPFRQLDSGLTRQHEGTGLGLAICKRLAERLGGTISVTSQIGGGSTFQIILPVNLKKMS